MTQRQVIGAWIAALALTCGALALLVGVAGPERHPFRVAEIAVIGSSLLRHAIPEFGGGSNSLLGDGRTHRRIGPSAPSEAQELALLEYALDDHPGLVLLEISPLIKDMHHATHTESCRGIGARIRSAAMDRQLEAVYAFRRLLSIDFSQRLGTGEPADLEQDQVIRPDWMQSAYPLKLHRPSCIRRLSRLLARARAQKTDVVFVLPPQSQAAADYMPRGQAEQLRELAISVANELHVPIFAPAASWSNSRFADNSHLNKMGRRQFEAELRQWWAGRQ